MIISILDCNHGFFEPEEEAANSLLAYLLFPGNYSSKSDIIVVQRTQVDKDLIEKFPKCKVVVRYGVGLDNIDMKEMQERGIEVINFPGFCTQEVATHTLALILFLHRRLYAFKQDGEWGNSSQIIYANADTVVGIVGMGRIGSLVAKYLQALGFMVVAFDPYAESDVFNLNGATECVSLEKLFQMSNIVTLHTPLTEETEGMINMNLFGLQNNQKISIVNTSRGAVINQSDLVEALEKNIIDSAYIDVCDPEPPDHHLYAVPNLFITSHCAFYSERSLFMLKRDVIAKSVERFNDLQSHTSTVA